MTSRSNRLVVSSGKRELVVDPPIMNAAGFLGFPDRSFPPARLNQLLGAHITPPLSLRRRSPAADSGSARFAGGFILHSGHPNPGLDRALRRYGRRWAELGAPLVVHLLTGEPHETEQALLLLEHDERVSGAELGLEHAAPATLERTATLAAASELPVILRLPLDVDPDAFHIAESAGAAALSLGPPRGRLPSDSGYVSGRMYGPALFPLALAKVVALAGSLDVPLIASGGLYSQGDLWAFLRAGAAGVQLDGLLWTRPHELIQSARKLSGHP